MNKSFLLLTASLSSKCMKVLEHDKGGRCGLVESHKDICPTIIQQNPYPNTWLYLQSTTTPTLRLLLYGEYIETYWHQRRSRRRLTWYCF